jgi:hypothetical protein
VLAPAPNLIRRPEQSPCLFEWRRSQLPNQDIGSLQTGNSPLSHPAMSSGRLLDQLPGRPQVGRLRGLQRRPVAFG